MCTTPICSSLPIHTSNDLENQSLLIHSHSRKPKTPLSLESEKDKLKIHCQQYLTQKDKLDSQSELNHRFGKAYPLQVETFVLHRSFKTNP